MHRSRPCSGTLLRHGRLRKGPFEGPATVKPPALPEDVYSQDLRERVFAAADEGEPVGRVATMLRVSVSYVSKVPSRRRLTGQTQARPQRCHVVPKLSGLYPAIEAQVSRRPDATIAELRAWLLETHRVSASAGLMNKTLAALDLTFKKTRLAK